MNTCPQCQTQHPDHVRICPNDGTVLTSAATDPHIGVTLDGKYRLESAIGRGGMGSIYRATHLMLNKPVAVKLINAELAPTPEVVRRFQREARAASHLNHPNIAATFDLGQTSNGTLYLAMELLSGQSLKDAIRAGGPMAPARIIRILKQVASALAAAHASGIVHRDLKPQNIMLTPTADGAETAKLLDFGIAKTFEDGATQLTTTGLVLGTPQYMSPEQAAGRPLDGRSDLYSLGIILFEMLVGDVPFNDPSTPAVLVKHLTEPAPPPSKRRPDLAIPAALESVALRCLAKEPEARFQSASEFASALELAGGAIGATSAAATVIVTPARETPTERTAPIVTPQVSRHDVAAAAPHVTSVAAPPPAHVTPPPPVSVSPPASASTSPPASRSVLPGLAAIAALLVIALIGAYAFAAGWFGATTASDAPPGSTPPAASVSPPAPPSTPTPRPASEEASKRTPDSPAQIASGPAPTPGPPAASSARSGGARSTSAAVPAGQTAPAAEPTKPANPTVAFGCVGEGPVCASLRSAMGPALQAQSIVSVNDPAKADIILQAEAEFTGERREDMFGTTLVTRTYSITLTGLTQVKGQTVPMPAPSTVSYDARVGQEKLNGEMRVVAAAAAEKIRTFWGKQ